MDLFKLVGRIVISNQEANETIDNTTEKAKGLGDALNGTSNEADNAGKKLGASGKLGSASVWLGNMFTKATELGVNALKFVGKTGFGYNSMMEQYQTAFSVLIGDGEKAKKLLDDLWTMAADTPMEMTGLAMNAQDLLNYGLAAEEIIPTLNMLGDAALGNQSKMDGISYALGQIKAYGKLRGQESMQMIENGFPILEFLEKTLEWPEEILNSMWENGEVPYGVVPPITQEDILGFRESGDIYYDDVLEAIRYATQDERYAGAMDKYVNTFDGQKAKLSDIFAQTIGNLTTQLFELSKSDIIPKITESLEKFGTWVSENQDTLGKMAEAISGLVTGGFDAMINAFTWMVENGEAVSVAIGTIATALTIGAIAAHPYATAIMAVAAGLAMIAARNSDGDAYNHFFNKFSDEELQTLQNYVDAVNRYREAEAALAQDESNQALIDNFIGAGNAMEEASKKAGAIDGLIAAYDAWRSGQAENAGKDLYLDVPMRAADDAQASLQGDVDGMTIEGVVSMLADTSGLQAAVNATNLTAHVDLQTSSVGAGSRWISGLLPGHASGLDDVPYDNYIARLHKGEAVLNSTNAEAWRSGGMGNTGRLEGMMAQLISLTQQLVSSSGKQVVLDSGVLVGQLAPALDTQLGTISSRKGRRN